MNHKFCLLVCMSVSFVRCMDTQLANPKIVVKCSDIVPANSISREVSEWNRQRCLSLGLGWKENQNLVKIRPIYFENGREVLCHFRNPRAINSLIKKGISGDNQDKLMHQMMAPQLPQYIPFDAVYGDGIFDQIQWFLYEQPIDITFCFEGELKPTDWHPGKDRMMYIKDFCSNPVVLYYLLLYVIGYAIYAVQD